MSYSYRATQFSNETERTQQNRHSMKIFLIKIFRHTSLKIPTKPQTYNLPELHNNT